MAGEGTGESHSKSQKNYKQQEYNKYEGKGLFAPRPVSKKKNTDHYVKTGIGSDLMNKDVDGTMEFAPEARPSGSIIAGDEGISKDTEVKTESFMTAMDLHSKTESGRATSHYRGSIYEMSKPAEIGDVDES